jgi:hypothetical protein
VESGGGSDKTMNTTFLMDLYLNRIHDYLLFLSKQNNAEPKFEGLRIVCILLVVQKMKKGKIVAY